MIRQTTPYGCGMYAIANTLGDDAKGFVSEERLEASRNGNTLWQLNKWLEADNRPFVIDPMYQDIHVKGIKLPEHWMEEWLTESNVISTPILIELKYKEGGLSHMVGAKIFNGTSITIFDSLKGVPEETTLKELSDKYYSITGIYGFQCTETHNWIIYSNE